MVSQFPLLGQPVNTLTKKEVIFTTLNYALRSQFLEWREFNVCLSLKAAGGKLMRSKIHQRVNRTITDLQFDENFTLFVFHYIFNQRVVPYFFSHDLDPNFTIEALVSAKRIDARRSGSSPFQSVANTVSRSFGRRFGANYVIFETTFWGQQKKVLEKVFPRPKFLHHQCL